MVVSTNRSSSLLGPHRSQSMQADNRCRDHLRGACRFGAACRFKH
jgi:hypothetical protein